MKNDLEQAVKNLIKGNISGKIPGLDGSKDYSIVETCMTDVMAIAYNHNIEEVIDDVFLLQVQIGLTSVSKQQIRNRVKESYHLFPVEIKAFCTYVALQKGRSSDEEIIDRVTSILKG